MKTERITIRISSYIDLKLSEIAKMTGAPKATVASAGLLHFINETERLMDDNKKPKQEGTLRTFNEAGGEVLPGMQDDMP